MIHKYQLRVFGKMLSKQFSYEEIKDADLNFLESDNVEILNEETNLWMPIKKYIFPTENSNEKKLNSTAKLGPKKEKYYIDEFGQIIMQGNHRETNDKQSFSIDEFGQVYKNNNLQNNNVDNKHERVKETQTNRSSTSSTSEVIGFIVVIIIIGFVLYMVVDSGMIIWYGFIGLILLIKKIFQKIFT